MKERKYIKVDDEYLSNLEEIADKASDCQRFAFGLGFISGSGVAFLVLTLIRAFATP